MELLVFAVAVAAVLLLRGLSASFGGAPSRGTTSDSDEPFERDSDEPFERLVARHVDPRYSYLPTNLYHDFFWRSHSSMRDD